MKLDFNFSSTLDNSGWRERAMKKTRMRKSTKRRRAAAEVTRPGSGTPWIAVGTFVACTALGGKMAAPADAQEVGRTGGGLGSTRPAVHGQPTASLHIASGPLRKVLAEFTEATGIVVLPTNEAILDLPSPGVAGSLTAEGALRRLLDGTHVAYRFTSPKAVTLELRVAESVDVAARPGPMSPKYTEPLRDVPQTVMVIPSQMIEEQNATTLRDVLRNVTGISIQAGEGGVPAGDNLSIRGFNARTDLFIDGVRDFGGYSRDPFNIEQVEVTKGPGSSYAGRGSTGGSINLATKAPHTAGLRAGTMGLGTDAYRRGTLDVNQPLERLPVKGAALRLNAMWTGADTPGRDVVKNRRWGAAPSLGLGLGTPTRVTVSYAHLDQENVPDYGVPWVPADNVPLAAYRDQPAPVDFDNFYGLADRDFEKTRTGLATAQVEHDISPSIRIRNLLRHGKTRRDSIVTAPRFQSATSTDIRRTDWKSRDQDDKILADQASLNANFRAAGMEHATVTGVEVARETSVNHTRIETAPTLPLTDLYRPNPQDPYTGGLRRNGARTDGTADSLAVYAFDTIKPTAQLELTGGLRWDRFSLDYESIDAVGAVTPFTRTDEMLSWRAGIVLKPRPNGSVYAGASTSLNPSAEGLSLSASTVTLPPEKSRSYELGTKWDLFENRLSVNAALFRTSKDNARTPGVNAGDPPTVLDGEQRVDGLDLGAAGRITSRWNVLGGYTYMDSEIEQSNTAAEVGREFGNTPRHSFSLWTSYRTRQGLELGGGVRYVGDRFTNNTNTRTAPRYWLIDGMAAYGINQNLTLRLNLNNLADERYIDRIGGGHFIPGDGRLMTLNASLKL
jgi:catecholate siderophore receptor